MGRPVAAGHLAGRMAEPADVAGGGTAGSSGDAWAGTSGSAGA
ncbi:hypothetical protein [Actinoplanes cyaneus]|nr:hypothetical protein [Actinoplanes cyaneus]